MKPSFPSSVRRSAYGIAAGLAALAGLVAAFAKSQIGPSFGFLFMAGVALSAWRGGVGPGLLSLALGAAAVYLFGDPPRRLSEAGIFVLSGGGLVWLLSP